ncbi:serine protease inhibitor 3/4 [Elysia marginata]|uniref:Serine protease inhibitor 3/4 n=1 Tax=Elysia marginata TaxID=1093978 RepID=A0AAV4JPU2_9GAST|nr:serine protease inhibitor 3/4 [Elysia marginata]
MKPVSKNRPTGVLVILTHCCLNNLNNLSTSATVKLNDDQVLQKLTDLAVSLTGITEANFKTKVADQDIDGLTRLDFKYGCTRGVYSTPMFTINDIFVEATTWDFNTWKAQIDKLLTAYNINLKV